MNKRTILGKPPSCLFLGCLLTYMPSVVSISLTCREYKESIALCDRGFLCSTVVSVTTRGQLFCDSS